MNTNTPDIGVETPIAPRRPRWGRRILLSLLLIVGLAIAAYYTWGWINAAAFRREVAALTAAGEPMTMPSLRPPAVPADQNGYVQIREAMALMPAREPENNPLQRSREEPRLPLFDDERVALTEIVEANRKALTALAPIVDKPAVVADHVKFQSPGLMILLPDLNGLRSLARAAQRAAILDFDAGRHDAALEQLRLIEPVARGAASHTSLVGMLVATGSRSLEADALIQMTPALRIGGDGGASAAQVKQTIARLLDDSTLRRELLMGMKSERTFQVDTMECLADGRLKPSDLQSPADQPGDWLLRHLARPVLWSNARYSLSYMNAIIATLDAGDWPSADARLSPLQREMEAQTSSVRYVFARMLLPALSRAVLSHYRGIGDRRLAGTALAVRHYQVDHAGQFPAKLADLVPAYLSSVPMDPLAQGKPLNYRADGEEPAIWSVGEDGRDDGGSTAPADDAAKRPPGNRWQRKDAVVFLKPQPRDRSVIEPESP